MDPCQQTFLRIVSLLKYPEAMLPGGRPKSVANHKLRAPMATSMQCKRGLIDQGKISPLSMTTHSQNPHTTALFMCPKYPEELVHAISKK